MPAPELSRRDLLSGFAGLAACALPGTARAADDGPRLGIQLYSLRGYPVDEALRHAREIGFRHVEFYAGMYPLDSTPDQIAAMTRKLTGLGLSPSAHGVNRFGGDAAANRRVFEFARAAGIRTLTSDPDPEAFASLDELVREFGIRVAIHNHGPGHRYDKVVDVLHAVEKHDERIGACADLGHFIRSGEDPVEVIRLLKGRLYGVHLKDFRERQAKTKGVILGQGHLDVPAVFAALERTGFPADGALSVEYEENPQNPLADIRQCFEAARRALTST